MEEDPHAEGARTPKRQRVDSGSGTGKGSDIHEILSIEAASAASSSAAAAAAATSVTSVTPSPATNFHSPAKVTINMKSPTSELPEPIDSSSPTLVAALTQPPPNATPTSIPNSNAVSASVPSSPEASPQIEIADPEDMEQDSNHSNWRPLEEIVRRDSQSDVIQDISDMTPLVDLFPRVRPELSASNSVARFIQIMDKGKST
jgi:ubiquitin carboxyl-terminal hydrolase 34